jgi:Na+-translocating ferredoxin:NAD+ oxidoreductase RnfD subunit
MFLAFYLGLVAANVIWLDRGWAILGHQMQSGVLLLFAFFMISDPMTIPNRISGRALHAAAVAIVAFLWQYALYKPNGLLWALFLCVPLVPLIDRWLPAERFDWKKPS